MLGNRERVVARRGCFRVWLPGRRGAFCREAGRAVAFSDGPAGVSGRFGTSAGAHDGFLTNSYLALTTYRGAAGRLGVSLLHNHPKRLLP